jgi:hypothetical protein
MIEATIAGETDPVRLAELAHRSIGAPREQLCEALRASALTRIDPGLLI